MFKIRQIKIVDFGKIPIYPEIGKDTAIVLQGPILEKNDFTFETVKLYRHLFPNMKIIISTWKGVNNSLETKFKDKNIVLLQSEKPFFTGHSNINLQITSTAVGLSYAKQSGCRFVLKSRTDQRINSFTNYFDYFEQLIDAFPIKNQKLQSRLIVCNLNMFRNRHYIVSDMFMFGNINDMLLYWNLPHQQLIREYDRSKSFLENNTAEAYFVNSFQENVNFKPIGTYEDSKIFFEKFFYLIDKSIIDLFWYKYNHNYERTIIWVDDQLDFPHSTVGFIPNNGK